MLLSPIADTSNTAEMGDDEIDDVLSRATQYVTLMIDV